MSDHAAHLQSGTQTLTADVEDKVTFNSDCNQIEVWSSGPLAFTVTKTDAPVQGSIDCYENPVSGARIVSVPTAGDTVVRLVSSSTGVKYNVTKVA